MDIIAIGVDQGLANIGYSAIRIKLDEDEKESDINILESGTINTKSNQELKDRLVYIYDMIKEINVKYNSNIVGCEKLFFNPIQKSSGRNKSASIMVTNMVSGILFLLAGNENISIKDFTPGTIKKYVAGHGRASKDDVIYAVKELCIKEGIVPSTDHEADAIAIGVTTARYYVNTLIPLMKATVEVEKAEKSKSDKDIESAKAFISLLSTGDEKTALNKRIDKLNKANLKVKAKKIKKENKESALIE